MHENITLQSLKEFAPSTLCPALVFRPVDMGSPQQDWARHLAKNPLYRRELEEFAVLGDTVVRFADGAEQEPIEKVKLLSLRFAVRALGDDVTDAMEFVRCVRAIASPDAGQFELEQIAAHYLKEIRRRGGSVSEVLKEMGMLGMHLRSVTSLIEERELECFEHDASDELRLTVADQRRAREIARMQPSLPEPSPNFDDELSFIEKRIRRSSATRIATDDFAEFYLSDDGKSIDELDADYAAYGRLEQYDENGLIGGASLDDGRRVVVMFDFPAEIDASYLPESAHHLAGEMLQLFVGHKLGGAAGTRARREMLGDEFSPVANPECLKDSSRPFSDSEFEEWLGMKLDALYPRRTLRTFRRLGADMQGRIFEFEAAVEVNPEFDEMSYVAAVCRQIWANYRSDFHLRSLRREVYQETHRAIRRATDTADLAQVKRRAYSLLKEDGALTLKEFTALNTAARSQEARLVSVVGRLAAQTLSEISKASVNRLRYLKFHLYNDAGIAALTRQEKQRLWDAVRAREAVLTQPETAKASVIPFGTRGIQQTATARTQTVKVYPRNA